MAQMFSSPAPAKPKTMIAPLHTATTVILYKNSECDFI